MAYTSGDSILDEHYNTFATDVNEIWGQGTGDKGYGQTTTIAAVADSNTITATQWATLLARISSCATHQGTSITGITSPTVGNTISAYTALSGNITSVVTNRTNKAATGSDSSPTTATTASWTTSKVGTCDVTFAGGDEARYFFNSGGEIRLSLTRTGGTAHAKNTEWTDICTKIGTIVFGANSTSKSGGSGTVTTLATTTGYYQIGATPIEIFRQYADTSPYTTNYIKITAAIIGGAHADGRGNTGTQVQFKVTLQDDAADDFDDTVNGTLTLTHTVRPPSTAAITDTWGIVTNTGSI